ncbi:MAG: hypothetical protein LBD98_03270 [Endomicrobium sp.]|jgi:hypothetical protein|nr:hypothetical protein [Endomicrobium sp.]
MNCIYVRPGYCGISRKMNCHEDCSYYLEKENTCEDEERKDEGEERNGEE